MKKVILEGREYFVNKHGVVYYVSGPDVIHGHRVIEFADKDMEMKILGMLKD